MSVRSGSSDPRQLVLLGHQARDEFLARLLQLTRHQHLVQDVVCHVAGSSAHSRVHSLDLIGPCTELYFIYACRLLSFAIRRLAGEMMRRGICGTR